jgi:hypothetical protein
VLGTQSRVEAYVKEEAKHKYPKNALSIAISYISCLVVFSKVEETVAGKARANPSGTLYGTPLSL